MNLGVEDLARGPAPPRPRAFRLVGPGAVAARGRIAPPSNAAFADDGEAVAVALDADHARDANAVGGAIPAADDLDGETLVVVLPFVEPPSFASRLFAAIGRRSRDVPRAVRCSALLARGYVKIGAGVDESTGADLAWGYAPARDADDEATGPC